ncbi:class I SAM-dependent methyltransferase [Lactobacillus sp. ESL0684]|uniref:tRNA (adenine(22)-N(1))-methyltransferase n=1 Tax=Lactobacillus sp. ESL0684 TaxID=2983213 RepID=UPI0023F8D370|nr:class I SAM-dependent methyltransferase [Lactobacillus sp. ESL0684]WEV44451.1 class I SAM-dependent methyltransferase [Lactobacillus sp. ESL0684]
MNLRLNTLAEMVDRSARIADIGTDHAYLPIKLVLEDKVDYAIASDIAQGPLKNAQDNITQAGLQTKITTRLGSGLSTITLQDRIDTVVIAGMGGKLITQILTDAWRNHYQFPTLILEPNIGEPGLREWLVQHSYQIVAEEILAEAGHTYELIKAKKVMQEVKLTPRQLLFGPLILQAKNEVFYQKWRSQLYYQQKLLVNLNKARNKDLGHIEQIEQEIALIKGELNDEG